MGTCDAARERETSKELVNLLNQAIESLSPTVAEHSEPASSYSGGGSVKDMLAREIAQVQGQKHSATQNVMSVDTRVKGLVLIKIMRRDLCPVELVKSIFDRVRTEKEPCSRHVVRIIPLQKIFYPNNNDLSDNIANIVLNAFPGAVLPHFEKEILVVKEEKVRGEKRTNSEATAESTNQLTDGDENETEDKKRPRTEEPSSSSEEPSSSSAASSSLAASEGLEMEGVSTSTEEIVAEPTQEESVETTKDESTAIVPHATELLPETILADATSIAVESIAPTVLGSAPEPVIVDAPSAPAPFYGPLVYCALFKARSHNIMTRESAQSTISKTVPAFFRTNYKKCKVHFTYVYSLIIY